MLIFKKINFIFLFLVLSNLQAQQSRFQKFSIENGLTSNVIFDVTQDKTGYLWIATDKGSIKFDGDDFTQINTQKTTCIKAQNNTIYIGLENGLLTRNGNQEHFFASKEVRNIFFYKEHVFIGTVEGLYKLHKAYLQPIQINAAIDFSIINDLIFDDNSFYIATNNGLWKLNSLENPKEIEKILKDKVISLLKFQNKIIAATFKNGIHIINNNSVEKIITTAENVSSIQKLKNEIWVTSTENGIVVFTLPSFSFKQKINKYNSLETNNINTVFKDNQNTIWIASKKGLYTLRKTLSENTNSKKPTIYFESLFVNNQNRDSLLAVKKRTTFSPSQNNISINFKTVDFINPKKIKYRYNLDGAFSAWSANNIVQLANLNAGKYRFEIQSKINGNLSAIKSFSFIIDQSFYKKGWFILAVIILFLFTAYLFLDLYIKKIKKKNREKINNLKLENHLLSLEQKALQLQMNPHFIFNVLNGIKALGNSGKTEELNTAISQFSILLRSILNNSRKEEISLKEEIESLKNYLELEQSMSSKKFEYSFTLSLNSIDIDEILIPTMLMQPFLENAIKHGFEIHKNGKILISFDVKKHYLHCVIIDNGIGIHQSKKRKQNSNHNSIALKVSKERIENIANKHSFSIDEIIEDSIIKGTKVWFKIPLKTDY
jgi:two-component system sensor histidine kinase LytS